MISWLSWTEWPGVDDLMDVAAGEERTPLASAGRTSEATLARHESNLAVLLRDDTGWISHVRALEETDVIVLLTPVVVPISQDPEDTSDPFEPLGRSLARRHQRVRQVPYTQRNGITSTHLGFIKRSNVVILCFAVQPTEQIQLEVADVTFAVNDNKPCIIVVCCSPIHPEQDVPYPTVIQTAGYSQPALEATVELMFGEHTQIQSAQSSAGVLRAPRVWQVEEWNEARDASSVYRLWTECISPRFTIDQQTLMQLLSRPGYAKHYIVRDQEDDRILGFCATFFHYVDQEGEKLIASVACLLIQPDHRTRGVGLSLHAHAIVQLRGIRGVVRLQLGSTYPRMLYGPPFDMTINEEWFRRRGWQLNASPVYDLVLNCREWPAPADLPPEGDVTFRQCAQEDMREVLVLVEKSAARQVRTGWFDQYWSLMGSPNVKDVLIGIEGKRIVAAALTYTPGCGTQIASNLPWAGRLGGDVGGVTCVCVDSNPSDEITIRLLDACIHKLRMQGMTRVFMDGVKDSIEDLDRLGFKEWARYRDVWKDA